MVDTAVILAAGLGSRLGDRTKNEPKGFLKINGKALLAHSIEKMRDCGIKRIIIGVGYLAEHFTKLEPDFPQMEFIFFNNPRYAETGSMYTFYCGRNHYDSDIILFESDLLYERAALSMLIESSQKDLLLASGFTESGDEVWIQTNNDGSLSGMSKKKSDLDKIDAELVGITKISFETVKKLCSIAEGVFDTNPKIDYETVLVMAAKTNPFPVLIKEDLIWCEIDDESHLERALTKIYPKIIDDKQGVK